MSKSKRKTTTDEFTQAAVQESANILFDGVLEAIRTTFQQVHIIKAPGEHQKERGIDFQIEVVDRNNSKTIEIFSLQNKGSGDPLKPLVSTKNKGLISFQISNRHVRYYRYEIPMALLFIVCDNTNKKVYWHPIQLDDDLDERLSNAVANGKESVQLFINPKKTLLPDTFKAFLNDVEQSRREQFFRISDERFNPITDEEDQYNVDRTKPILDQVYELMDYLYDQVRFQPIHLLIRHYPFQKSKGFTPYYHWFKVYTDNEELVELFASIRVKDDNNLEFLNPQFTNNVNDYEDKAKQILLKLSQNHIYGFVSDRSRKEAATRYFVNRVCDCVACRYFRLDVLEVLAELNQTAPQSLDEGLKYAYMHYQLGNFLAAAKLFEEKGKQAKAEKKDVYFLICEYNRLKLGRFIKNHYFDPEIEKYGRELEKINLDRTVLRLPDKGHDQKLMFWIRDQRFFYEPSFSIRDYSSKMRNEYQGHLRGDRGSSSNFDELVSGYAQLHSFVNGNYIVYDKFSEYELETDDFIEGFFAGYAMCYHQGNKPAHLTDYHLHRFVFDGKHKTVWRYFNKYHLQSVKYVNGKDEIGFHVLLKKLLTKHPLVNSAYNQYSPEESPFYRNPYPRLFGNMLCMASIIEMTDEEANGIALDLKTCMSLSDLGTPDGYEQVNSFIACKRKQLTTATLTLLLIFFLDAKDFYNTPRLVLLAGELKRRNEKVAFNTAEQNKIVAYAFEGEDQNFNAAVSLHAVADGKFNEQLKAQILSKLRRKFDTYHFYYAVIFSVIELKSEFLDQFLTITYPDPSKYNFRRLIHGEEDNKYPLLDMLFNLCFKLECKPGDLSNRSYWGVADYYDWLLDITNFDYSKFKIDWIGLYTTKFYFAEFRRHPILRTKVENYLKTRRDERIERLYFDIYNPCEEYDYDE
jgi:hypothetical protein